ncbi:hypothetical protein CONLIGDRAFT_692790 [Coniochaeta ligniaria NRRL 30616]|uniref:Uncharacterized protein n=1 Tax=Coniochaeta ligniaria NRRL 30616 TaxID=1408157 RepID=A0A1J7I8G6_9PEZI|nr:hypothetical protein CONLIGDRAFT_692790 [Coniochaeta ligniaria NRRL 30616]
MCGTCASRLSVTPRGITLCSVCNPELDQAASLDNSRVLPSPQLPVPRLQSEATRSSLSKAPVEFAPRVKKKSPAYIVTRPSMDWIRMAHQEFRRSDLEVLEWQPKQSRVLIFRDLKYSLCKDLTTESEWKEWLSENHIPKVNDFKRGLAVILAGRAEELEKKTNPALLRYLPWGKDTFEKIIKCMQVNASVVRIICTGENALFNRTHIVRIRDDIPAIVYNCRTANTWVGDMALSATYIPSTHSTYAIVYGCTPENINEITGRLKSASYATCHPLLLPGIFAELERKRQFELVEKGVTQRFQFVSNLLQNDTYDWKSRGAKEKDMSTTDSVNLWMAICYVSNGLKKWKQQLSSMIAHIDELSQRECSETAACSEPGCSPVQPAQDQIQPAVSFHRAMREGGVMIRERLTAITMEYDEKVRDCDMIMEGMTMATELAHAKANMEIAVRTRRDSSQMRSIALLTMIFLPATFVAVGEIYSLQYLFSLKANNLNPNKDSVLYVLLRLETKRRGAYIAMVLDLCYHINLLDTYHPRYLALLRE